MDTEDIFGEEGIKFDVTANLSPDIYAKLALTIIGAVLISAIGIKLIENVLPK